MAVYDRLWSRLILNQNATRSEVKFNVVISNHPGLFLSSSSALDAVGALNDISLLYDLQVSDDIYIVIPDCFRPSRHEETILLTAITILTLEIYGRCKVLLDSNQVLLLAP